MTNAAHGINNLKPLCCSEIIFSPSNHIPLLPGGHGPGYRQRLLNTSAGERQERRSIAAKTVPAAVLAESHFAVN